MTTDRVSIAAVGDIMLGDHPVRFGNGVRSLTDVVGVQHVFSDVRSEFEGCDVVFGNLEVCHSNAGLIEGVLESEEFRGAPSAIPVLTSGWVQCFEHGKQSRHGTRPRGVLGYQEALGTARHLCRGR